MGVLGIEVGRILWSLHGSLLGGDAPTIHSRLINAPEVTGSGEVNTGDPQTLANYLIWAARNYPSRHMALVIDGHRMGCLGVTLDDMSGGDTIWLPELRSALQMSYQATGKKLDVLLFRSCMMSQVEVAYQVRGYVDYLVASESPVMPTGFGQFDFHNSLSKLVKQPEMTPRDLAVEFINDFDLSILNYASLLLGAPFGSFPAMLRSSVSAIEVDKTEDVVSAMALLTDVLIKGMEGYRQKLLEAYNATREFGPVVAYDLIHPAFLDLYDFAEQIAARITDEEVVDACLHVMFAVADSVIATKHLRGDSHSHGMGVLGPRTLDEYELFVEEEAETEFGKDTRYAEFLWALYQGYSSEVVEDTFDPPRALHRDFLSKVMNRLDPSPNTLGLTIILAMAFILVGTMILEILALPIVLGVAPIIIHFTLLVGILLGGVVGVYLRSTDLISANIIEGASLGYTLALLLLLIGPILLIGLVGETFGAAIGGVLGALAGLSAAYPSDRSGLLWSALAGAILGGITLGIGGGLLGSAIFIILFGGIWVLLSLVPHLFLRYYQF
jgi:hypothetical protein